MTETISPAETQAAEASEPPRLARPETDAAALRAIEEATAQQQLDILILAKVDPRPAET